MASDDYYQDSTSGDFLGEDRQVHSNFFTKDEPMHELSKGTSRVKVSGQPICCLVNSEDQTMHVLSCNGKCFRTCSEDVQPDLPIKKL